MSYHEYWSLSKLPFGAPRRRREFFAGRGQHEALARFEYLVDHGRPLGLLIGPSDSGRTTLLRQVDAGLWGSSAATDPVWLEAGIGTLETLRAVAGDACSAAGLWRAAHDRVTASARSGGRAVLLVDDGDAFEDEVLQLIGRLACDGPGLTALVACRPEGAVRVASAVGGCPLRIDLPPWELSEVRGFLAHGLTGAGGRADIFTDQAVVRLFELSDGLPGRAARLAELALLAGAGQRAERIGPELVETARTEVLIEAA